MKIFEITNAVASSYWGMYAVQSVLHSVIASMLVESAIYVWNIKSPAVKQWFRVMVIILPVATFPAFQFLSPTRGDIYFRLQSLLDSNRWMFIDLWPGMPLAVIPALILGVTSLIFLIQELLPIVSHISRQRQEIDEAIPEEADPSLEEKVAEALQGLPIDRDFVEILSDEDLSLFSSTGRNPKIFISTGLIRAFSVDHLHVAFAHEIAHVRRSKRPVLILAYIFRVLMFYNPVAMMEFRRLAQDEEKVCDDIAVMLTGKPDTLAEAIQMLRPEMNGAEGGQASGGVGSLTTALENYSHDVLLKSRIVRIGEQNDGTPYWGIPYVVTAGLIVSINYFVV